jgi:hypothetical protein
LKEKLFQPQVYLPIVIVSIQSITYFCSFFFQQEPLRKIKNIEEARSAQILFQGYTEREN